MSAFVAGTLASMDQTAIIILRIIGNHLSQHSFDALSLTNAEEVLKILQEAQDSTDPALVAQQGVVSNTVARINQVCVSLHSFVALYSQFVRRWSQFLMSLSAFIGSL